MQIFIWLAAWLLSLSSARAELDSVIIDALEIGGVQESSSSFARALFNMPLHEPIERNDFQEKLKQFELGLAAIYKTSDIHLKKGALRDHVIVVVDLPAENPAYFGFGAKVFRIEVNDIATPFTGTEASVFAGSRNIAQTRLMVDLEAARSSFTWQGGGVKNLGIGKFFTATLLDPALFSSPYELGSKITYYAYESSMTSAFNSFSMQNDMLQGQIFFGRRIGLHNLMLNALGARRSFVMGNFGSSSIYDRGFGLRWDYSQKSYLIGLEPGLATRLSVQRHLEPMFTLLFGSALKTFFIGSRQALTPKISLMQYSHPGMENRRAQVSATYEWATTGDWILGAEILDSFDQNGLFGLAVAGRYYTSSFLIDLGLAIGATSIDQDDRPKRPGGGL